MPRDARLGFVVGVTVVILIGVIFYHGNGKASMAGNVRSVSANKAGATKATPKLGQVRTHKVQEGETLSSIAVLYYDDVSRVQFLFNANRSSIPRDSISEVPVGTVLIIPDLPPR